MPAPVPMLWIWEIWISHDECAALCPALSTILTHEDDRPMLFDNWPEAARYIDQRLTTRPDGCSALALVVRREMRVDEWNGLEKHEEAPPQVPPTPPARLEAIPC